MKPTATDTLIHYDSCHPCEHKLALVNYLENRTITYPMTEINRRKEINICQHILNTNGFKHVNLVDRIKKKINHSSKT
jgi:hypothetical protein